MTLLDLMEKEIRLAGKALTIREALRLAEEDGTLAEMKKIGKTPQNTISALLHKDIKRGESARFIQVSNKPAIFDLKK